MRNFFSLSFISYIQIRNYICRILNQQIYADQSLCVGSRTFCPIRFQTLLGDTGTYEIKNEVRGVALSNPVQQELLLLLVLLQLLLVVLLTC